MTYKRAAIFLFLGILLIGFLAGCKSPPPPPPAPAPAKQPVTRRTPPPTPDALPALPPEPSVPARPVTRGILELISKSAYETRDLQYFISSGLTLEHGKGMQVDIEIYQSGEGVIQEINAQEKIIIPRDTGGVLIPDLGPATPGGPRTLRICFDNVDEHTLTFRENPSDHRYYLAFREDRHYGEFTEYGNETYRVTFNGEVPYLYVRLDERTDDQPRTRQLQGRYLAYREYNPEPEVYETEASTPQSPATPPPTIQETTVPGRAPQPSPATPAPDDNEDELDLEALLGL